jgi:hypothetical protein
MSGNPEHESSCPGRERERIENLRCGITDRYQMVALSRRLDTAIRKSCDDKA